MILIKHNLMNRKLKIFVIMLTILFGGLSQLYSQEQTAYHKQLIEIKKSLLQDLTVSEGILTEEFWKNNKDVLNEKEADGFLEQLVEATVKELLLGVWSLETSKKTAAKFINKFIENVLDAKKLKSTNASEKELDDAQEESINQFVTKWYGLKMMIETD